MNAKRLDLFASQASSLPRLMISMLISSRSGVTKTEIVDRLMETGRFASRDTCIPTVTRNLDDLERNGHVALKDGQYYPLAHSRFVVKEEEPWFSWFFLTATGLAIAFFLFSFWTTPLTAHSLLVIVLLVLIFVRFLDDFFHTTR